MPLTSLAPVLTAAETAGCYAVGMVCLGYEDAALFVELGEELDVPVILQAGPGARRAMPIDMWGKIFTSLAAASSGQVVAHLDHGEDVDTCRAGLDAGFSSVMFDGSRLPISENKEQSHRLSTIAKRYHASVELEVGHVGYAGDPKGANTIPEELLDMHKAVPEAALALSVGNIHLQTRQEAKIDWSLLSACRDGNKAPFVIHGGSGVSSRDRARMAREFGVRKINIGTEMRQASGAGMREYLADGSFDKLGALAASVNAMRPVAKKILKSAWQL